MVLHLGRGNVTISNVGGGPLLRESRQPATFTANQVPEAGSFAIKQGFVLGKDEVIYGLGQQQSEKLNQRGQQVLLSQHNTSVAIPFFQSVKGYGVFWDNYSPTKFADSEQETSFDSAVGSNADYCVLYGGGSDGVVAQMRELTGQAPLMPLWVYGFSQSRERYKTQVEALGVPLDGIVQEFLTATLVDAVGRTVRTFPLPAQASGVHSLDLHALPMGVYALHLRTSAGTITKRLTVQ